ncbi:MAG TPA: preprotein translocase subunit SecY, partial [Candidatus Moranbacteria bacterium]|nr:preprotein translocase subunit SecY [Candidatus Moranbacteria bacterium]
GPYITAAIVMQLLQMIIPKLEKLNKEEGEAGRQKFNMITRVLTVPFAMLQTYGMIVLLRSQQILQTTGFFDTAVLIITATAGTIFLMWLGELISEKKIGNGISILIFAGIVAALPSAMGRLFVEFQAGELFTYIAFAAVAVITIITVVFMTEAQRNIPIAYAKGMRLGRAIKSGASHLPLRVNQAGVIPIIFAISIVLFPQMVAGALVGSSNPTVASWAATVSGFFGNTLYYGAVYFVLVLIFAYFYTAIIFDPKKIAENLQKQGGYIPGIRPGGQTEEYLHTIMNRITFVGALFLGLVAVLPLAVQSFTGIQALTVGGTSILIAVSVVIDMIKQIQGQLIMRDYEKF